MTRVSKDPQERRSELVDAAERLFLERGFESTAVSDIVKAVNVAQGTFYCYFKTKTDVLQAVAGKTVAGLLTQVREIVNRSDTNACQQLADTVNLIFQLEPADRRLLDFLHMETNLHLHHRVMQETLVRLTPLILHIVNAGVVQGRFKVAQPAETTALILGAMVHVFHAPGFLDEGKRAERTAAALEHLLTRTLGAKPDSIKLDW